jgi:hypothetical protein
VSPRLVLALALALTALASPASAAEQAKRYPVTGEGVTVAVPNSWVTVTGAQLNDAAVLDEIARENPRLASFLRSFAAAGGGMRLVALDPAVKNGFATNLNVVSAPAPGSVAFEQYRRALIAQLRAIVSGKISDSVVRIGGQQAIRLSYRLSLTTGGKRLTVQTLQYAFLKGRRSLVFTYTTLPRFAGSYAQTFKASAASIRFTR